MSDVGFQVVVYVVMASMHLCAFGVLMWLIHLCTRLEGRAAYMGYGSVLLSPYVTMLYFLIPEECKFVIVREAPAWMLEEGGTGIQQRIRERERMEYRKTFRNAAIDHGSDASSPSGAPDAPLAGVDESESPPGILLVPRILAGIWTAFAALHFFAGRWEAWRTRSKIRKYLPVTDEMTGGLPDECRQAAGLKATVPVFACHTAFTPFVIGALRPLILVPGRLTDYDQRDALRIFLLHEFFHIRHRDTILGLLFSLTRSIFFSIPWFIPRWRNT